MKKIYAVFDTNVLVSSLMSRNEDSPTVLLLDYVMDGSIVLLYNEDILAEYDEVLHREKFAFSDDRIDTVLELVKTGADA
jgi:putative PIN family toxin of toxin-antitoxin system